MISLRKVRIEVEKGKEDHESKEGQQIYPSSPFSLTTSKKPINAD